MSTDIVQLASDLGSFHDVDPSDMLERIRAGLVGEVEPLRRVGVLLDDMSVRNKAVEMGLAATTGEVDAAAKMQARYALILDQSSKAQGDYARTADDATNATRTAEASYKDAMRELGDNMLPLIAEGADVVSALAEAFGGLPESVQSVVLVLGGLSAAAGPALIALGSIIRNLEVIKTSAPRAAAALGMVGLGVGTAVAVFTLLPKIVHSNIDSWNALRDAYKEGAGELTDLARGALAAHIEAAGLSEAFAEAGVTVDDVHRAAQGGMEGMTAFGRAMYEAGLITKGELQSLGGFVNALNEGTEAGKRTNAILGETEDAGGGAAKSIEDLTDELDAFISKAFAAEEAGDAFNEQLLSFADRVRAAQIEGDGLATSLSDMTLQGLANRATLRGLVTGITDTVTAMREQRRSEEDIAATTANMRAQLEYTLTQLGFNKEETGRYLAVLGQIPQGAHTVITADSAQAVAAIDAVIVKAGQMNRAMIAARDIAEGRDPKGFYGAGASGSWGDEPPAMPSTYVPPVGLNNVLRGGGPAATAARNSGASDAKSAADEQKRIAKEIETFLAEHFRRRVEIAKNMHDAGIKGGEDYVRLLDEQLAHTQAFTDDWLQLQEERRAALQVAEDLRRNHEDRMREIGEIGDAEWLAILDKRLAGEQKYSDRWLDVWRERERALDDQRDQQQEAVDDAERIQEKALDRLNDLLDDEQRIRREQANLAEEHRKRMADIQARFVDDQQRVISERRGQLLEWAALDERASVAWGNSVSALTSNVRSQTVMFVEWAEALEDARRRGVSEQVISMLGLDEGPQALGQLRMFTSATQAEIDGLNAAVVERAARTDAQVTAEATSSYSAISSQLRALAEKHAAEVEAATEEFLAEQRELNAELAAIGEEGGRSFGLSIADGINSSIPAIQQAAAAARQALADLDRARQTPPAPGTGPFGGYATFDEFYRTQPSEVRAYLDAVGRGGVSSAAAVAPPVVNVQVQVGNEPVDARVRTTISAMNTAAAITGSH
jgi:hypothetical protein